MHFNVKIYIRDRNYVSNTRFMANETPLNGHYTTDNGITSEYEKT